MGIIAIQKGDPRTVNSDSSFGVWATNSNLENGGGALLRHLSAEVRDIIAGQNQDMFAANMEDVSAANTATGSGWHSGLPGTEARTRSDVVAPQDWT